VAFNDRNDPVTENTGDRVFNAGNFDHNTKDTREMENTVQADITLQEKHITITNIPANETDSTGIPPAPEEVTSTGVPVNSSPETTMSATTPLPENIKMQIEAEQKIMNNVMSICLTSDGLVIRDEEKTDAEDITSRLSGVYCEGVQYYDLNGVQYINNTGMAILIDLLKSLLEMGVEVQFVNVHDSIKKKIKQMGLERIINYGENAGS
jgi:anti-anti-sigma factor